MNLLPVLISAPTSLLILFVLTRLIGPRQVTELTVFDYINSITAGSIAADMAQAKSAEEFFSTLLATFIYMGATLLVSYLTQRFPTMRTLLVGRSALLFDDGSFDTAAMSRSKIDVHEFLMLMREAGYFSLSHIQSAVMEPNGSVSFLPKAADRPLTPRDIKLPEPKEDVFYAVITDGKIQYKALSLSGLGEGALLRAVKKAGLTLKEVYLATVEQGADPVIYADTGKRRAKGKKKKER